MSSCSSLTNSSSLSISPSSSSSNLANLNLENFPIVIVKTNNGYCGAFLCNNGENISNDETNYNKNIIYCRDEAGNKIYSPDTILSSQIVVAKKLNESMNASIEGKLLGYLKPRQSDPKKLVVGYSCKIASTSINNTLVTCSLLTNPLTLHNKEHEKILTTIQTHCYEAIDEYLNDLIWDNNLIDKILWLINLLLYIDDHKQITLEFLIEVLKSTAYSYQMLPPETNILQPLNLIFNNVTCDGIIFPKKIIKLV